jgi:hypothetical protein
MKGMVLEITFLDYLIRGRRFGLVPGGLQGTQLLGTW